jgi:fructose-1,6-bisphosphatase/inositol monophosphatase family enzyme
LGSAGCSICYVACGKLGAAFGISVKTWDVAGSVAIAKAAGCEVRIADGETPESLHFIAGKGKIVDQIQARLKKTVPNLDWRGI